MKIESAKLSDYSGAKVAKNVVPSDDSPRSTAHVASNHIPSFQFSKT